MTQTTTPVRPSNTGLVEFTDLTPEQQAVVEARDPTLLVGGGAGVGKTTTALWVARRELEHPSTAPYMRVLFLTFSRTAVAQILARSRKVLAGLGERVEVMTFHGLAYRLVRDFGRYLGYPHIPALCGDAETKLGVAAEAALTYDDLLPAALALLAPDSPVHALLADRWSLVVCDEFQDTDDQQWRLLELLGAHARLLLLADPNQMIYGWRDGVDEGRLQAAMARPGARQLLLPNQSYRDPSQILPAAAEDIRWRRFDTPRVHRALADGRLLVYRDVPPVDREQVVADQLVALREAGYPTAGVFARSNADTADLSVALNRLEIDHIPVGFPEAYGEALATMLRMVMFSAAQATWDEVRQRLAIFLTATIRAPRPPALAHALLGRSDLPRTLAQRLRAVRSALTDATDPLGEAVDLAQDAWASLSIARGQRAWTRAAATFGALVARGRLLHDPATALDRLAGQVDAVREASFVELDAGDVGAVQVMNFTQTKGREADATVLVFDDEDFFGNETEPFETASRLLYVAMTRARHRVIVLLPEWPHPLVAPLQQHATTTIPSGSSVPPF